MNVTYLLGAGASANVLRPVDGMKESLQSLANELGGCLQKNMNDQAFAQLPLLLKGNQPTLENLIDDINWVIEQSRFHETVDTLAKKFYLINQWQPLQRLKEVLVVYFMLRQLSVFTPNLLQNNFADPTALVDRRYDSLVAAIARKTASGIKLPENVKIIIWNYDMQLELALMRYVPLPINEIQEIFQIFPNQTSLDLRVGEICNLSSFAAVKLNGNAIWSGSEDLNEKTPKTLFDRHLQDNRPLNVIGDLLSNYHALLSNQSQLFSKVVSYFNFAWETDETFKSKYLGHDNNLKTACDIASVTDILVVIGYSFPIFNRETDRTLFNKMLKLKKVYVQDPQAERIKATMENSFGIFQSRSELYKKTEFRMSSLNFRTTTETNQFLIPTD